MKQNPDYYLCELAGSPYLMPVGQAIADHKRGLKTNATGVYLWNLFQEERSLQEALALSAKHFEIPSGDFSSFREDITLFIRQLLHLEILTETTETKEPESAAKQYILTSRNSIKNSLAETKEKENDVVTAKTYFLSIGGLTLNLFCPETAFPPEFSGFLLDSPHQRVPETQQTILLHSCLPEEETHKEVLLHNPELNILKSESAYLLHFPAAHRHLEIHLSKDGHTAHCYSLPPYDADFRYDFFHAIRLVYLFLAQKSGMVALHSASLLYRNKLWLFSGHSGAGKSTHTSLWNKLLGTPLINGDLNLIAHENGSPVVHGIPWCGTSGIFDTKSYPLGGIILLDKAQKTCVEHLANDRKILLVSQHLISPAWTKEHFEKNLRITEQIQQSVPICLLHCTKEDSSVAVIKEYLDSTF